MPEAMRNRRNNLVTRRASRRKGLAAMELALVLPILGVLLLGLLEFTMLFYARSSVVEACRAGARAATRVGSDASQVEYEASQVLFPSLRQNMQVEMAGGRFSGDVVTVAVQVPMNSASPDLLWMVGFGLQGRTLYAESTMIKE
jgi:Flp pilus assembly protein TadG